LDAISPKIGNWLYKIGDVYDFYRRKAADNEKKMKEGHSASGA
jgi:hypothetical protein